MITDLLKLTRPLVCVDTETTGLDVQTCRIVELAFHVFYHDERPVKEWRTLINPGVPISAEVSAIHGITDEHVHSCQRCQSLASCACPEGFKPWPTFKQLAASLAKGFTDVDYLGQNVRYDLRILDAEMRRAGQPWSYTDAKVIDSKMLEQLAEPRSLSHLYRKYTGETLEGAHGAMTDVRAVSTVVAKQLETYSVLPRDVGRLHEMSWPGWLCDGGEFRMVNGVAVCQFGKWRGKSMQSIEASYWDWILSSTFPEDVKALAREAKLGRYPNG